MDVRQLVEGAAQVIEALLVDEHGVGGDRVDQPEAVGGAQAGLGVHRDLLGPRAPAVGIDRRVAGDLVDPRLEGDLRIRLAQSPQRGQERLLGHVLGAPLVAEHSANERRDSCAIAAVELLEGGVVAPADRLDEIGVRGGFIPCGDHSCVPASFPEQGQDTPGNRILKSPHPLPRTGSPRLTRVACAARGPPRRHHPLPRRAARGGQLQGLRAERPAGAGRGGGRARGDRRVGAARALRASRAGGRPARDRPPRPVLGLPSAHDRTGDEGAPAHPVRRRHVPRRLSPARSTRTASTATTRSSAGCSASSPPSRSASTAAATSASSAAPRTGSRSPSSGSAASRPSGSGPSSGTRDRTPSTRSGSSPGALPRASPR